MGLLNRRHLRIKVLQALYAYQQSSNTAVVKGEKELFHSIDTIYHLYFRMLSIFGELHHQAELRIEENKGKIRPSAEDLNPNRAFVDNQALLLLTNNQHIAAHVKHYKINWSQEEVMLRKLFTQLTQTAEYAAFMERGESTFEEQKEVLHSLFKKYIANYAPLHDLLDELSIYWQDDLDLVCVMVLRTIKDLKQSDTEFTDLMQLYKDEEDDTEFVRLLFFQAVKNQEDHFALIDSKTGNWELERIALMDRLLMNLAITEAKYFPNIPLKVTLNEYIEISKFYSTPKSNGFINGILDKVMDELNASGTIRKTGRGLKE
ncbi:MAG TPA: transcription antitermination protein NusB [Luteibaculaceae bacterium]|nr:transcription antitermination protein NusB [Luteibaculaceae bacterium]